MDGAGAAPSVERVDTRSATRRDTSNNKQTFTQRIRSSFIWRGITGQNTGLNLPTIDNVAKERPYWNPEQEAGWLSRVFYSYCSNLVYTGYRKTLMMEDLWDVADRDEAQAVSADFHTHMARTRSQQKPQGHVWRAITSAYRRPFLLAGIIKFFHDLVMFATPLILEQLLSQLAMGAPRYIVFLTALGMFGSTALDTISVNYYFHILFRMSLHLKVDMIDMLYQKSLRVTSSERSKAGVGSIVNLQSNDAAKIFNLPQYLHVVWNGPFQIIVIMGLLVRIMRWIPSLAGLAVTIVMIPISAAVGKVLAQARRDLIKATEARVKAATEIITGIKAIKLYAWEEPHLQRINDYRAKELKQIRRTGLLSMWNAILFNSGPVFVSLAAFGTYQALGYELTAAVAFPALALFNLLRFPIIMLPMQIVNLVNAKVSLQRIQKFMEADEMEPQQQQEQQELPEDAAVCVSASSFSWEPKGEPVLQDIQLQVPSGKLVVVVGQVGCGKSSLLGAILHEMHSSADARVITAGSIAYTSQDPWIQNSTLRNNVLMGQPFDEERYWRVIKACALEQDLAMLPAGDSSEIGEKGINLSGGQKHRVALARACYADADIYLLDDPLSAVDAHVGRQLLDECITGLLAGKTRVLVTHQLQVLPSADLVLVMQDGRVTHSGTHQELEARGVDLHEYAVQKEEEEHASASRAGSTDISRAASRASVDLPRTQQQGAAVAAAANLAAAREAQTESTAQQGIAAPPESSAAAAAAALEPGSSPVPAMGLAGPGAQISTAADTVALLQQAAGSTQGPLLANGAATVAHKPVSDQGTAPGQGKGTTTGTGTAKDDVHQVSDAMATAVSSESKAAAKGQSKDGKLVKVEERAVGSVSKKVYRTYFAAWGPFMIMPVAVLLASLGERGTQVVQNYVLTLWSNAVAAAEAASTSANAQAYFMAFFLFGALSLLVGLVRSGFLIFGTLNASKGLHDSLLARVVRLPMSFFDSQPTGRLLNRFTKDTEAVDLQVGQSLASFLTCLCTAVLSMVVVVTISPAVLAAAVVLGYVYYRVQGYYANTSRELKRLDSINFSPIFQHFSETLQGLQTIRAFSKQGLFLRHNTTLLNTSNRSYWPAQVVNRWLSVRLELMGAVIVFCAAVFVAVVIPQNAGLAGLALTSALNLTSIMNWMVRQTTELEVNMNSVERMVEYTQYEEEAPAVVPGSRPPQGWPDKGEIEAQGLVVRYRPELDPVLRGLSFKVRGCEKVGVCGRTGCGKSTLMMALYRIVEPCGGRVLIDGIDTSSIGLYDLRSKLSLVPQDPVIFSGSVRSNLDPFGQVQGDGQIWEALRQAGLDSFVKELPSGLDSDIREGGANMSVGQRQLLCMARALLRASRILVLDEATSNVDNATDALIQRTIRSAFKQCTVLTIAHRLHTIIDSDRIMLLDAGQLAEFDAPQRLLADPGSSFSRLVAETSIEQE